MNINAYFSGEVLKDCSTVHSCRGSYATVAGRAGLQVSVDTTHWELPREYKETINRVKENGQTFASGHEAVAEVRPQRAQH